jgi:hypothetical protein
MSNARSNDSTKCTSNGNAAAAQQQRSTTVVLVVVVVIVVVVVVVEPKPNDEHSQRRCGRRNPTLLIQGVVAVHAAVARYLTATCMRLAAGIGLDRRVEPSRRDALARQLSGDGDSCVIGTIRCWARLDSHAALPRARTRTRSARATVLLVQVREGGRRRSAALSSGYRASQRTFNCSVCIAGAPRSAPQVRSPCEKSVGHLLVKYARTHPFSTRISYIHGVRQSRLCMR